MVINREWCVTGASVHVPIERNSTYIQTVIRYINETRWPEDPHLPIHRYEQFPQGTTSWPCYMESCPYTTRIYPTLHYATPDCTGINLLLIVGVEVSVDYITCHEILIICGCNCHQDPGWDGLHGAWIKIVSGGVDDMPPNNHPDISSKVYLYVKKHPEGRELESPCPGLAQWRREFPKYFHRNEGLQLFQYFISPRFITVILVKLGGLIHVPRDSFTAL